jgi:hypothetical protein
MNSLAKKLGVGGRELSHTSVWETLNKNPQFHPKRIVLDRAKTLRFES